MVNKTSNKSEIREYLDEIELGLMFAEQFIVLGTVDIDDLEQIKDMLEKIINILEGEGQ